MLDIQTITLDDPNDKLVWRQGSGDTVEIYDIVVSSERRKGKGRQLVNNLLNGLPDGTRLVWAITRASNHIAIEFYREMGFRVVAPLYNFYGVLDENGKDTVDAIMFGRVTKPEERHKETR